ncbi:MAG: hypothetical protein B7C24_14030 [Bacteroidetes bacterium 4572_77]|nr:MAG: hypothetical protein B7C24_14030 [Bacteroidetes bacterium 4572_77]
MEMKRSRILSLPIDHESDVGICRRKAVALANQMGFNSVKSGEIAILVTEMVTNVLKHGGRKGKVIICQIEDQSQQKAFEVWCCDIGDGFESFKEALKDGFSAVETLGLGLGSIRRFSDELEINPLASDSFQEMYFEETYKNCLRSRKWVPVKQWLGLHKQIEIGGASVPKPGENYNGDAYVSTHINDHETLVAVIDGLGHGKEAHLASSIAKEQLIQKAELPLDTLMNHVHQSIKGTRGAVIGLAKINTKTKKLAYTGIGNIECFLFDGKERKTLLSFGGIMGHNMRTPRIFELNLQAHNRLCLYSDGITSRWKPNDLDWDMSCQKIAENIINQYSRNNDDATVLIIRYTP